MSETKWTPGPWSLDPGESFKIKDAKKNSLAAVMFVHLRGRRDRDEVAANAYLIAAAPELYDALDVLSHVASPKTLMHARAALAKARGETS